MQSKRQKTGEECVGRKQKRIQKLEWITCLKA